MVDISNSAVANTLVWISEKEVLLSVTAEYWM